MFKTKLLLSLLCFTVISTTAQAYTPSGSWTLAQETPSSKDYFMRIDVDPGEKYTSSQYSSYAPSSVYWAEYITFKTGNIGYLGLQRADGKKLALASIWDGISGTSGALTVVPNCNEFGACSSIKGEYNWKVGHDYRFRVEQSPRNLSTTASDHWQITLTDLTLGTVDILGELETPKWGGLQRSNSVFLEYFWGPYQCNTLRHAKATLGQIKGNYGTTSALVSSNGNAYGDPHTCNQQYMLPNMQPNDHGSSSWNTQGTLTLLGNNYRGIHKWGNYQNQAKKGMMFASNPDGNEPYIYEALHDGVYGAFPKQGQDNKDWKSIGIGYPIINDLYFRNQRVYEWEERNNPNVKIGDFFIYHNPYTSDTEYFKLKKTVAGNYPIDKTDNMYWEYVGRYPKKGETLTPTLPIHTWDANNRYGKKGWVYYYPATQKYFILKQTGSYWYFPTTTPDNDWWQLLGSHS